MATAFYIRYPGGTASISGSVDVNIHDASGNNISNGQQTMANSVPVVVASNQTAIPVSASTLPLPTGAATAANQVLEIASTDAIGAKLGTLGQKNMAGSAPVVFASDQSTLPVSAASLPLPSGAATAANQATEIASLASIDAGIPAGLGQTTMAASMPVVLASNQSAVPTQSPVNANGNIVNTALTATSASTASVPANAVGFVLEAPSTNTDNIRWCIGGTASTTVGMLSEPGRDTGYIPCAANISVCATVSGTNAFSIQWVLSA